jgi:predicted ATPase
MLAKRRVILSGGPGAGKTTLLLELGRRGYRTISESAREVIAERLAQGDAPRPNPETFAREILRRDLAKYDTSSDGPSLIFFDRSAVEALGMLSEAAKLSADELTMQLKALEYSETVFVLPPWADI